MKNKKQTIILGIVAVISLLALIIGATYAYFQASGGTGTSANVNVLTYTTDRLDFQTGSDVTIYADATTFAQGKGNASGNTFAKAILTANNKTNEATKNYYLYLDIETNNFMYTQNEDTPELILSITDESGNPVTDITSLNYKTVTDGKGTSISGYDITNKSGLVTLFDKKEIVAKPTKTDTWNVTITLINYDKDQSNNMGKSFKAKLMIQQEAINENSLVKYVISQYTGTQGENNIYFHNSSLANGASDNSYRYAGGDYKLTDIGKATGATNIIGNNNTEIIIEFYCDGEKQTVGIECDSEKTHYYLIKGETTQYQTYNEALSASVEKGYLTEDNIKNFVCFGSSETPCPTENLYRIVGVIDGKVKLIKWNYAKSSLLGTDGDFAMEFTKAFFSGEQEENMASTSMYYWNKSGVNTWSESNLNNINLNTNFITKIGTNWANKIATTTWKVGGNTDANIIKVPINMIYQNEIKNPAVDTTFEAKIGLMYVSDYGYAAIPSAWTSIGVVDDPSDTSETIGESISDNWMYGGCYEWTISRNSSNTDVAFGLLSYGDIYQTALYNMPAPLINYTGVRPVFYLKTSVTYVSGTGTKSNPIRIEI